MFEQAMLSQQGQSNRGWSVLLSFGMQAALVSSAVLLSMWYTDTLPNVRFSSVPLPPPPLAPPVTEVVPQAQSRAATSTLTPSVPTPRIALIPNPAAPLTAVQESLDAPPDVASTSPAASTVGVPGGSGSVDLVRTPPPPPPPTQPVEKPRGPIRVSSGTQAAKLIKQVMPVYPPIAKSARISGTVHLMGTISKDGSIRNLQVVDGPPLLVKAALEAVRQWVYRPTLLSNEPVEVLAPIEVRFILN